MPSLAKNTRASVIPCLRYRDAPAALEWLCRVFGFETHLVVSDKDGGIAHAELSFGNGMIMLGRGTGGEWSPALDTPMTLYLIVKDADALYVRAKAAGAQIVLEIKDQDYGGRGFSCRDLEGRLWNFGTYDPWSNRYE